jgi:hypothetical protein
MDDPVSTDKVSDWHPFTESTFGSHFGKIIDFVPSFLEVSENTLD